MVPLVMVKLAIRGPVARHRPVWLSLTGPLLKLKYNRLYTVVSLLAPLLSMDISRRVVTGLISCLCPLNLLSMKPNRVLGPPKLGMLIP